MTAIPDELTVQGYARTYGPMLDQLQQRLETRVGPLLWDPRTDPEPITRRDGTAAIRIGTIHALGVPLPDLDLGVLGTTVNAVLTAYRFAAQPPMTGSRSGHLICESHDAIGAEFTLLIKGSATAWVDVPS